MMQTHSRSKIAAWLISAALLTLILYLHLLPALLAGLLVYELIAQTAPLLQRKLSSKRANIAAVALLAGTAILITIAATAGMVAFLHSDAGSFSNLFSKLAEIVERARQSLPPWLTASFPDSADALHDEIIEWLRSHAAEVQGFGKETGRGFAHILIGMIIGAMVAIDTAQDHHSARPLASALTERVQRLGEAFRRIVFAQIRISAINTVLTALFLAMALPLSGIHLPLVKTMIVVTFIAGLLPVIGNLISNTLIVVVALSYSLEAGVSALVFLVVVHKFEYFLNARIVGSRISSRAWELLLAILLMESAFGLSGVIAAPIYYAYLKDELDSAGLV